MSSEQSLRLALPKGRMFDGVERLLADAGVIVRTASRAYRPTISGAAMEAKMLKPQNIIEMLDMGTRDLGFAGADWVKELGANLVELLDTELDPVWLVVAAPHKLLQDGALPPRKLTVASEYAKLTADWQQQRGRQDVFVRSFGSTEVFPSEDADYILDITSTGATLDANGLTIVEKIFHSSTRLYASRNAMQDPQKSKKIQDFCLVLQSVLEGRRRVMVEANVPPEKLPEVMQIFPAMKQPTVANLLGDQGYAIKSVVEKKQVIDLIPALKAAGACDIIITNLAKVVL